MGVVLSSEDKNILQDPDGDPARSCASDGVLWALGTDIYPGIQFIENTNSRNIKARAQMLG